YNNIILNLYVTIHKDINNENVKLFAPGFPATIRDHSGYNCINNATVFVQQLNLFRSADGHIHALWFNFATGWHHEDRTVLVPGVIGRVGGSVIVGVMENAVDVDTQHNLLC